MDTLRIDYDTAGIVWFFVSLPLIITTFFRFGRVWSLRNFDLMILLNVASGVVVMRYDDSGSVAGIAWMLTSTSVLLVRVLLDSGLKKRPRIEPNLQPHALIFLGLCGIAAATYAIAVVPLPPSSQQTVEDGRNILSGEAAVNEKNGAATGPGTKIAAAQVIRVSEQVTGEEDPGDNKVARIATGIFAGLGHLAILAGLIFIAARHFDDVRMGIVMATLYVLLPSTVLDPNSVNYVVSAALVLWALAMHRVPWAAGIFMGLACGSLLYPAFLLPVWFAFYGRKHGLRFGVAMVCVWSLLLLAVALSSADIQNYVQDSLQLIAAGVTFLVNGHSPVTWRITDDVYRAPILGSFLVMLVVLTIWPRAKRFEHLLAASAAIVVGIQFWYPQQVGEYMTGYIPLVVLMAFRPRLQQPTPPQSRVLRNDNRHEPTPPRKEPALTGAGTFSAFR